MVWKERLDYLRRNLAIKKPGPMEGQLVSEAIYAFFMEKMVAIECHKHAAECMSYFARENLPSVFQPWDILKVLAALLCFGIKAIEMNAADRVGVDGVAEEISRVRTTAVQFTRMRDKVLSLLSAGLVPYSRLVLEGHCDDGNPLQQCNVCREEVTVKNADVAIFSVRTDGVPVLVLEPRFKYTLCGRTTCYERNQKGPFAAGKRS